MQSDFQDNFQDFLYFTQWENGAESRFAFRTVSSSSFEQQARRDPYGRHRRCKGDQFFEH
jgi:hypothetical protein